MKETCCGIPLPVLSRSTGHITVHEYFLSFSLSLLLQYRTTRKSPETPKKKQKTITKAFKKSSTKITKAPKKTSKHQNTKKKPSYKYWSSCLYRQLSSAIPRLLPFPHRFCQPLYLSIYLLTKRLRALLTGFNVQKKTRTVFTVAKAILKSFH
ncbi:hypothetical protein BDB00DRAFT_804766, partial [Zychaea mexicana]|uniref:uncharacterized protein n=1 Tax=Zychaea mexicana TaxID=64656 RepID=UPI0022FE63F7